MEISTHHDHRAAESYKGPNGGRGHGDWCRSPRESVDQPGNGYKKPGTRPSCNSAFQSFPWDGLETLALRIGMLRQKRTSGAEALSKFS